MMFSCSHVASFIDLPIHLLLNSRIVLEHKCVVLTSRIFSSTCGLEAKSSRVTRVLVVIVLSLEPRSYFKRQKHEKLDEFRCHQEEQDDRLMKSGRARQ